MDTNNNGAPLFTPEEEPQLQESAQAKTNKRTIIIGVCAIGVVAILGLLLLWVWQSGRSQKAEAQQQIEQLQLEKEMMQSANEFAQIESEFAQMENQTQLLANDSLIEKYTATKAQVEKLMKELENQKNKSAEQIKKLQDEIATLKGILRDYVQLINELKAENADLRNENETVKSQNAKLNQQVQQVTKSNEQLNERMTLAEKLNVTGLNLVALNKKGKIEKNVTKAKSLKVTFTIPQNNSTPAGEKTIYLRITSPEGNLLSGNGGTFTFEGQSLPYTARTTIEYANEEIGGIEIFWDVNTTLNPGEYRVELFADNYRLASRSFTLSK